MTVTLRSRAEVPAEQTWDLASLYPSTAAWEADLRAFEGEQAAVRAFQGRLAEAPATLLAWLQLADRLQVQAGRLFSYAQMSFDVDTGDQAAAALREQAIGALTRVSAAASFAEPELLAAGKARVDALLAADPALGAYAHHLDNLWRRAPHVRSGEVEQLLAEAGEPLSAPESAYSMLAEGDMGFADAADSAGLPHPVARGNISELLQSPDRALRRSAWASYQDAFVAFKNTLGAIYAGSVKGDVFRARARGYTSALEASLSASNLPRAVYDNVIDACNRHLPVWHRYWALRARALGLERMEACDIWAPLGAPVPVEYGQAVELICEGLAPLGEEYVAVSRAGLTHERWVDIYPNDRKSSGAYSGGSYGSKPFILMNYEDSLSSVSTLAHELGHSMHTWLTNRTQPPVYSGYSLFVAEVASNFNQALLRGNLLQAGRGRAFELAVIEEAMSNFHRYLFLMPILSQFEQQVHGWAEAGEAVTADRMGALLGELFERGYGPAVQVDAARDGVVWAQFPHLYQNYYVFQYASGIAAANALADGLLRGEPGARERYLRFLRTGGSVYPLEALRIAGVDMTAPESMDRAFGVLSGLLDRLERILSEGEKQR
jgi:oligoendopeptidase F